MCTNSKYFEVILNIDKLSCDVKKLNLYCNFFSKSKKIDIKRIEKEILNIKKEIEKIENML